MVRSTSNEIVFIALCSIISVVTCCTSSSVWERKYFDYSYSPFIELPKITSNENACYKDKFNSERAFRAFADDKLCTITISPREYAYFQVHIAQLEADKTVSTLAVEQQNGQWIRMG